MKVSNPLGLQFIFSDHGALQSAEVDPIRISMTTPVPFARSAANLYLRKRGGDAIALLGPGSPSRYRLVEGALQASGQWAGLEYVSVLQTAPAQLAWQWQVHVQSKLEEAVELDVIYVQDIGLKAKTSGLVNAYYVSQYLERRVFDHPQHGSVVCCRQNMAESGKHPWLLLACAGRAIAATTDGLAFFGNSFRATRVPEALQTDELAGELSGEASLVALQEQPFVLGAGQAHVSSFVASYVADHPEASSERDLQRLPDLVRSFTQIQPTGTATRPEETRFSNARLLPAEDLSEAELTQFFGNERRHAEHASGQLLSFFTEGPRHVVLRAKETRVDRPHGHIMQANTGMVPHESIMSTTAFACGVFHSHVTQGNTNFTTLLSVCTQPSAPNLEGQRIFIELEGAEFLLGVPSAFEMGLNSCRWIYKHGNTVLQVCSWSSPLAPLVHLDVQVLRGAPVRLWLTHQFDGLNGWSIAQGNAHEFIVTPRAESMLAEKFARAQYRLVTHTEDARTRAYELDASPTLVLEVPTTSSFFMSIVGEVEARCEAPRIHDADAQRRLDCARAAEAWKDLSRSLVLRGPQQSTAIDTALPWFGMNALIHYLTPYGLEQFSGAAWGTRDVCQGPIDLLLCQEKFAEAKQVLRILFSHQDPDGGWPQWWMFDSFAFVRADSAHGDVVYWTILALCSYVKASGDFAFLRETLPYFAKPGLPAQPAATVSQHVTKTVELILSSFVPGTALVQFGGGDWNDSLQPVSEELAQRMISSWTVQMCYQALTEYRELCERAGDTAKARELQELCERIHADFNRHLVKDDVVAGYGLVGDDRSIEVLLHPSDTKTGVHYSLLPMNRGVISGTFSKERAEHHLALIERHLTGPDGARLMDRPLRYHGGLQELFQRAESSTYFGREIGLMYTHEHLRYAESLSRLGKPEAFLRAMRQAIPVDYQEIVPQGDLRQANCYYSSSDVLFRSRYEADERYGEVVAGEHSLKGGWRVYSSGPGIYIALVVTRLLGIRVAFGELILDPVLAKSLDGLKASLEFRGRPVTFEYRVHAVGFGPHAIVINGKDVTFGREENRYREGGATLPIDDFLARLNANTNTVVVTV